MRFGSTGIHKSQVGFGESRGMDQEVLNLTQYRNTRRGRWGLKKQKVAKPTKEGHPPSTEAHAENMCHTGQEGHPYGNLEGYELRMAGSPVGRNVGPLSHPIQEHLI